MHILLHCGKTGLPILLPIDRVSVRACAPQGKGAVSVDGELILVNETGEDIRKLITFYGGGIVSLTTMQETAPSNESLLQQLSSAGACIVNALWHKNCSERLHGAQEPPLMTHEGMVSRFTAFATEASIAAVAKMLSEMSCSDINKAVEIHKAHLQMVAGGEA